MKFKFLLAALLMLSLQAFSQSKNTVSLIYGTASSDVNIHGVVGDYGYASKAGMLYGIIYSRGINKRFSVETGLLITDDKALLEATVADLGRIYTPVEVKLVSIPILAKYNFSKYFFADAGVLVDKQTNYDSNSSLRDQSGLGAELGVGGQLPLGKLKIFVNPYLRNFNVTTTYNNLYELGVKFGLGYSF